MNRSRFGLSVRPGRRTLPRADGLGADVADVRVVRDAADGSASHADLVLRAGEEVLAQALCVGTLVKRLPAWKKLCY